MPNPESTLLIIRLQDKTAARLGSRIASSFLLLYAPFMLAGVALQVVTGHAIFSRGVLISTLWLGLAPLLIQEARRVVVSFFTTHRGLFHSETEWERLRSESLARFDSSKYLLFAIPWALATSLTTTFVMFREAPLAVQSWSLTIYFAMFFVSAIGFQGILTVNSIISRLLKAEIAFNPYHPDSFGGLQSLSNFLVKGTLFFSTGSLVLPLVFEMLEHFSPQGVLLANAVYLLTAVYIGLLLFSFVKPIAEIKLFIDERKENCILDSQKQLAELYDKLNTEEISMANAIKLYTYNELYHKKLYAIKEYPYDFSVLVQLVLSLIIPIAITAIERSLF